MAEGYRIWPDRISTSYGTQPTAHLRAKREINPDTARALANVIIRAQQMLADLPEDSDGAGV